ncbi:hypothetical protein LA59_05585 [Vibrio harveyi]|uniref:ComEC/Rec2 family competence protein n=1 Tax=Vibrio harveyi TaxID=669 RepID=UPI0005395E2B|nr:MBL fold metallo-hydrolase [Vibrio harveyi]AIV04963.1 hypothetical protein LA59_05585 [Vibrio harveyi]
MKLITLTESNSDSFLIKVEGKERQHHILIDGGYKQNAKKAIGLLENIIEEHQMIDLVILTHVDTDHINGLLAIFKSKKITSSTIGTVLFNVPHSSIEIESIKEKSTQCGYSEGNDLLKIIVDKGIKLESAVQGDEYKVGDDVTINILAPTSSAVEKDHKEWRDTNIGYEAEPEYDKKNLVAEVHREDDKPQNVSSIVCLIKSSDKTVLMCGDSVPSQIISGVSDITPVDLMKIPHHGSKYNINDEVLKFFPTKKFLIPGSRTGYPNYYTIALLENYHENSTVYVPSRSWVHKPELNNGIELNFVDYKVGTEIELC